MKRPTIWIFAVLPVLVLAFGATGLDTLLISLLGILAVIVGGPIYVLWLYRRQSKSIAVAAGCILLTSGITVATMEITSFPLRIGYRLSKGQMDQAANRLLAGETLATPCWIGLIRVRKAELSRHGIPCLWTHPHPNGNDGFVQTPPDYVPFNLWSHTGIDDKWQFISED